MYNFQKLSETTSFPVEIKIRPRARWVFSRRYGKLSDTELMYNFQKLSETTSFPVEIKIRPRARWVFSRRYGKLSDTVHVAINALSFDSQ
jgi:hypothetical protein